MVENISVRDANLSDVQAISKVFCASWKYAYDGIVDKNYLESIENTRWTTFLAEGISNGMIDCLVVEEANKVVGASVVKLSRVEGYPDDAEIVCFYLLPECIGKGMGQVLFQQTKNNILEKKHKNIILDVLSQNDRAINFYKKQGFETVKSCFEIMFSDINFECDIMRLLLF